MTLLTKMEFDQVLSQVEYDRATAQSDELATLEDQVWSKMMVASRHALLVRRFEALSAAERNYAARVSIEPGRAMEAEKSRLRAVELLATAVRHREASEKIYEEGAKLREEAAGKMEQQQQQNGGQRRPQVQAQTPQPQAPQPQTPQPQPARTVPRPTQPSGDSS